MKLKTLFVAILLSLSICVIAQGRPSRPNGPPPGAEMRQPPPPPPFLKDLGLTQAQTKTIMDAVRKFHMEIREINQGDATDKQVKIEASKNVAIKAIKSVLVAAKVDAAKQDDVIKKLLAPRPRRGGPGGPGGPPNGNGPPPPPEQ